ncbi:MAG: hypothetical protein ABL891_03600 [Burkholderiales bacterium]
MSRRFFHYLCIFLLLVAQQGALVHAAWHAGGDAHAHSTHGHAQENDVHDRDHDSDDSDHESPAGQASLCAFDLAFGQVLGGVHGSCALPVIAELRVAIASYAFNPRLGTEAVPALSRGPPIFL